MDSSRSIQYTKPSHRPITKSNSTIGFHSSRSIDMRITHCLFVAGETPSSVNHEMLGHRTARHPSVQTTPRGRSRNGIDSDLKVTWHRPHERR